jgi:hypothetical protein
MGGERITANTSVVALDSGEIVRRFIDDALDDYTIASTFRCGGSWDVAGHLEPRPVS